MKIYTRWSNAQLALSVMIVAASAIWCGCAGSSKYVPPYINSLYVGPEPITPRPDTAFVEVYLPEQKVDRGYILLATVEITTMQEDRTADNMLSHAKERAREVGADALIDVSFETLGASKTPEVATNSYTGKSYTYTTTSVLRALKAKAIRWK